MARITVEDCLDKTFSRFSLVMLVARRAKQLIKGADATVKMRSNKDVVIALREVAAGNVFYAVGSDTGADKEIAFKDIQSDLNR